MHRTALAAYLEFVRVANVAGLPAMSVPFAWSGAAPVGVHFTGRVGADATLFGLAAQIEQARPWAGHRPRLAAAG